MMQSRLFARACAALLLVTTLWGDSPVLAQLPKAQLKSLFPSGGKVGSEVEVTVGGTDLDNATQLFFSDKGITAAPVMLEADGKKSPVNGKWLVKIANDVTPGVYECRVVGRFGVSNPRAFVAGTLEEVVEAGGNSSKDQAQVVPVGSTVSGKVAADSFDYYKVTLKQGQSVLFDCQGERIDSRLDATLILYDSAGSEIAKAQDTILRDPVLDFAAPTDGDYIVSVNDFVYAGGEDYAYRLSIHAGPYVDFIFPPVGEPGKQSKFTVFGRNLPQGKAVAGMAVDGAALQQVEVDIALSGDEQAKQSLAIASLVQPHVSVTDGQAYQWKSSQGVANAVTIGFAQAPIVIEGNDNNSSDKAQVVSAPCEYVGQFYPRADRDWVQFDAKKGDVYTLEVVSHRLGVDSDPVMSIYKVSGTGDKQQMTRVVEVDDAPAKTASPMFNVSTSDPIYQLKVSDDTTYRIQVRDLFSDSQTDPRSIYRLIIRKQQPDFRLVAFAQPGGDPAKGQFSPAATVLRRGGTSVVNVQVIRRDGFAGDVEVSAEGLPNGVSCFGATIGGKVDSAALVFSVSDKADAVVGSLRIVGKAKVADKEVTRVARAGGLLWGVAKKGDATKSRLLRELAISVIDGETVPVSIKVGDGQVLETSLGGKVTLPIKVTRYGDFKTAIKLDAVGLPKELKPGQVEVKETDGNLAVAIANAKIVPGTYTFYLQSTVKYKYDRNPNAIKEAEEAQKEIAAKAGAAAEGLKTTAKARDDATKASQNTANQLKTAQQQKQQAADAVKNAKDEAKAAAEEKLAAASKALAEAETANKTAADAKTKGDADFQTADKANKDAQKLKQAADKRLADVKKVKPKDINFIARSTPAKIRVVASPVVLKVAALNGAKKPGDKVVIPVTVERKYGFDDAVSISFTPAKGVAGISAKTVSIPKGQNQGKLELTLGKNATPGDHVSNIKATLKFNNVSVSSSTEVALKVDAPPES